MSSFQERVINELSELSQKVESLSDFLSKDKPDSIEAYDWYLLELQLSQMVEYEHTLKMRVWRF